MSITTGKNTLVVGGGPVGLFTAWTLTEQCGCNVKILSHSKVSSCCNIYINGSQTTYKTWSPCYQRSSIDYGEFNSLIIAQPFTSAYKFLKSIFNIAATTEIDVLVLSTYSINLSLLECSKRVFFGSVDLSVEAKGSIINSTDRLRLNIWTGKNNYRNSMWYSYFSNGDVPVNYQYQSTHFNFRAVMTYATYKVMVYSWSSSLEEKVNTWVSIVRNEILANRLYLVEKNREYSLATLSKYATTLISSIESCSDNPLDKGLAFNIRLLLLDNKKMINFMKDYEDQQLLLALA